MLCGTPAVFAPFLADLRNAGVVEVEVEYDDPADVLVPVVELGEAPPKQAR